MKRDVAITFVEGVPGREKNKIIKRFLEELAKQGWTEDADVSSIPRLFGTDADTDILSEAYERLPKADCDRIECVRIFEGAA